MELKEFIKTAIADITAAINESQEELNAQKAYINPILTNRTGEYVIIDKHYHVITHLNFDLAVTTTEAANIGGNVGGSIKIISAKLGTEQQSTVEHASRLTFELPIVLPSYIYETPQDIFEKKSPIKPGGSNH
jgi:hypothetical protein